jgi:DNA-binding transcriptional ArsR family regulator
MLASSEGLGRNAKERLRADSGKCGRIQSTETNRRAGVDRYVTVWLHVFAMSLRLDQTLAALADPTRRELLARLARRPHRAGELARGFAISRPAICKHTRLLKKAGLIRAKQNGREQIYELAPSGNQAIEELIGTLQQVGRFWDTALDSFKHYAESKPEAEPTRAGEPRR